MVGAISGDRPGRAETVTAPSLGTGARVSRPKCDATAVAPSPPGRRRGLINDLKRYGRLAVAWDRHGSPVPRWTLTSYGPDDTRDGYRHREEEEEEEFFNHYKNDLERHAHTLSGVAGADLKSQSGGALGTPTLSRFSPPMTCTIPLPNLDLPRAGRNSPGGHRQAQLSPAQHTSGHTSCPNTHTHTHARARAHTHTHTAANAAGEGI